MQQQVAILRPGALGDVIASRAPIGQLRYAYPDDRVLLLAPGKRGQLLARRGLADAVWDTDRAETAWLYDVDPCAPPRALQQVFANTRLAVAFLDDPDRTVASRLTALGCGAVIIHPARPDERSGIHIHDHLCLALQARCPQRQPTPAPLPVTMDEIRAMRSALDLRTPTYAVLHPGSGSARKNWPASCFMALGQRLAKDMPIVVTAGEADDQLGVQVGQAIRGARCVQSPSLPHLAALLADARLYVGNDSGVSHLASAVSAPHRAGVRVVLFGPTSPAVWGPPGAHILRAPEGDLSRLGVEVVWEACQPGQQGFQA